MVENITLVIRHKGETQNRGNKKTKHAKFSKKQTFSPLMSKRTCACPVTYPRIQWRIQSFLGRPVYRPNSRKRNHGWRWKEKFSKFVPPDALKMHSLVLSVLRFPCKTFSKLPKFTLRNTLLREWFLKNSYIQKKLYGYKLERATKRSEQKRCSN